MLLAHNHDLKGPNRPPRTHDEESRVLEHDPLVLLQFNLHIVGKQRSGVGALVGCQLCHFSQRFLRETGGGPDLAVGVRVRAAHGGALVLEYLHVCVLRTRFVDGGWDLRR